MKRAIGKHTIVGTMARDAGVADVNAKLGLRAAAVLLPGYEPTARNRRERRFVAKKGGAK